MDFTIRWPVLGALRSGIRRLFLFRSKLRTLKMPALETSRLKLRPFDQKDHQQIVAWGDFSDAENADRAAQEILDYCFREYRERGIGPWAIQLKETGTIVGDCAFPHLAFRKLCGEVNYYIAPQHRGRGLAPEALTALFVFGFSKIGLTRIQARCAADNWRSERVMQKSGMKFEGFVESGQSSQVSGPKQKLYVIHKNDFHMKSKRAVHLSIKTTAPPDLDSKGEESP